MTDVFKPQNKGELKAIVKSYINRDDPDSIGSIDQFIATCHNDLDEAVGPLNEMIDDTDSNSLLLYASGSYYIYGTIVEYARFNADEGLMQNYEPRWNEMLSNLYIGGNDTVGARPNVYSRLRRLP